MIDSPPGSGARRSQVDALRTRFGWTEPAQRGSKQAFILIAGLPGTGKSYVAHALAERFGFAVLRSDEVRKALFPSPDYSPRESGTVYLTSYALVRALLNDGYAVVFDATNLSKRSRRNARVIAERAGVPFLVLVTVSPPAVVSERLRQRRAGQTEAYSSDAGWEVHQKLAQTVESFTEAAAIVDTSAGIQEAIAAVEHLLSDPPTRRQSPDHTDTGCERQRVEGDQ